MTVRAIGESPERRSARHPARHARRRHRSGPDRRGPHPRRSGHQNDVRCASVSSILSRHAVLRAGRLAVGRRRDGALHRGSRRGAGSHRTRSRRRPSPSSSSRPAPTVSCSTCVPDELTLKVNGRARQIRSLRYVSLPAADPAGAGDRPCLELEAPYGSNVAEGAGRWVTIVVDHESIRPGAEKNVMNSAVRFRECARAARPGLVRDDAAMAGSRSSSRHDHQKVAAALRKFVGRAPRESSEQERSCRSRLVLNGMRDLLRGAVAARRAEGRGAAVVRRAEPAPRRRRRMRRPARARSVSTDFQELRTAAALRARICLRRAARRSPCGVGDQRVRRRDPEPLLGRRQGSRRSRESGRRRRRRILPDRRARRHRAAECGPVDVRLLRRDLRAGGQRAQRPHPPRRARVSTRQRVRIRTRPEVADPEAVRREGRPPNRARCCATASSTRALPLRAVAYASAVHAGKVKIMAVVEPAERGVKLASAVFGLIDSSRSARRRSGRRMRASSPRLPLVDRGRGRPGSVPVAGRGGRQLGTAAVRSNTSWSRA